MAEIGNLSDNLQRLISANFISAHPDPTTLTGSDLDALKGILRGKVRPDFPVDRKRALDVLARSESSSDVSAILADVLADQGAPVEFRMSAAHLLRRIPPKAAEAPLIAALKADDERLRRAVLGSLGQVGGKAARKALSAMPMSPDLTSALLLIGLRDGTHEGGLSKALGTSIIRITAAPLPDKEARRILDALGGHAVGAPLTPEGAVSFTCRAARHAVFMVRDADFSRAGIVAAVVRDGDEPGDLSLRYLVLFAPEGDSSEIALVTPGGRADYAGHGSASRSGMIFRVRDTGAAPIALSAEATLANGMIRLTLELPEFRDRAARRARTPQPILTTSRARTR